MMVADEGGGGAGVAVFEGNDQQNVHLCSIARSCARSLAGKLLSLTHEGDARCIAVK